MNRNSTLQFITDEFKNQEEFFDVYEMLDPQGKSSSELKEIFRNVEFSPSNELISKILMNT